MKKIIHKSEERGNGDYGWLKTRYSFSFADWYDPSRMGFGKLRVINDDIIAPDSGFGAHSHKDMEIITIVREGAVTHKDNMGNMEIVPAGDVQVMSAGTGVTHSEYNGSKDVPLALFQIWIEPKERGIKPRYFQKSFGFQSKENGITLLVSPEGKGEGLNINQDAYIYHAILDGKSPIEYELVQRGDTPPAQAGVYIFVIEGSVIVGGQSLSKRDAIGVWDTERVNISTDSEASILIMEVPVSGSEDRENV